MRRPQVSFRILTRSLCPAGAPLLVSPIAPALNRPDPV